MVYTNNMFMYVYVIYVYDIFKNWDKQLSYINTFDHICISRKKEKLRHDLSMDWSLIEVSIWKDILHTWNL